jgi:hypothetical protein
MHFDFMVEGMEKENAGCSSIMQLILSPTSEKNDSKFAQDITRSHSS